MICCMAPLFPSHIIINAQQGLTRLFRPVTIVIEALKVRLLIQHYRATFLVLPSDRRDARVPTGSALSCPVFLIFDFLRSRVQLVCHAPHEAD